MQACTENELVRHENQHHIFAGHVQMHFKRGGPPLKRVPVSCDDWHTCFAGMGWFYAHPKPHKVRWFCIRTRPQNKFSKHRMQSAPYMKSLYTDLGHLRLTDCERTTHTYTQTPVGTGKALSSGCLNTMRRNWRTLWKSVCIGLFFVLLYCKKGHCGRLVKA